MLPPTILTERLILAAPSASFFNAHFATMSDPRVAERIGAGAPHTRTETWRRYCQVAGMWGLVGYGYWAVLDRTTGAMIGFGGLARFERGIAELDGVPEAGWAFNADWWGRGLATEFVGAIMEWADATLMASKVRCVISLDHAASLRVAARNGFVATGTVIHDDHDVHLLTRDRYARLSAALPTGASSPRE